MTVTAGEQTGPMASLRRRIGRNLFGTRFGPGSRRLGFGGSFLLGESLFLAWSLISFAQGRGVDFTWGGLRVAAHPDPFLVNGVALTSPVATALLLGLALFGGLAGGRLWLGGSPRLALVAAGAWILTSISIVLAGGAADILIWQVALALLIVSGAWARRRPGTRLSDLLRADAVRPVGVDV